MVAGVVVGGIVWPRTANHFQSSQMTKILLLLFVVTVTMLADALCYDLPDPCASTRQVEDSL